LNKGGSMSTKKKASDSKKKEKKNLVFGVLNPKKKGTYQLRLYVAGQTPKSLRAFQNLKKICQEHLAGKYKLEVIDLLRDPQLARGDQILALPTLVRNLPRPVNKIIGDLSNTEKVLVGLNLRPVA